MGLFFNTWTEFQQQQYDIKSVIVNASVVAFAVVLTQYFVSRWIIFGGKIQRSPHIFPVYVVSAFVFLYLWSAFIDLSFLVYKEDSFPLPLSYQLAIPLVVVGGIPLHLLLYWARGTSDTDYENDNEIEGGSRATGEAYEFQGLATEDNTPIRIENADSPSASAKVHYINNIKIFLTNIVIIHHAACCMSNSSPIFRIPVKSKEGNGGDAALSAMLGIDQSYFMNLFFFISGYFVPNSFERKGTYVFLLERVRRLGIPFVLYGFFIGPFCAVGSQFLFLYKGDDRFPNIVFESGTTWFVLHLMFFNVAYAVVCGREWSPQISCPSLSGFFCIASALGLFSGILSMFFPPLGSVGLVPLFWNEYLSYVVFFFGGALAQKNRWMEALRERPRKPIYLWAASSALVSLSFWDVVKSFWATRLYSGFFMFGGMNAVSIGLAVTVFFMDYVDKPYRCTNFFAKSMYTAYLIHVAFPLQAATKCWILILEATNNIQYVDNEEQGFGKIYYYIENGGLVYLGFLFVSLVALMITWPMAYCIRSIPGFSKVL